MTFFINIVVLLSFVATSFLLCCRGFERVERRSAALALVVHGFTAVALTRYYADGSGDMTVYFAHAVNIARLLRYDWSTFLPEVAKLISHRDNLLPINVIGEGTSTGSMSGIAGVACYLVGDSPYAVNVLVATFAFVGQAGLYRALRITFATGERKAIRIAMFFVPSVVFWTSGVQKEAILIGFFGILVWAIERALRRRSALATLVAPLAAGGVALIKSYLLLPLILAVATWIYVARSGARIALFYKLVAVAFAIAGFVFVTRLFPEWGLDQLAEGMQHRRDAAMTIEGGSNVEFGADAQRTLYGQLIFAPLALANTLFRPFLFEVRNFGQLFAGLETTIILCLLGELVVRHRFTTLTREIRRTPILAASVVLILSFGLGVGLATSNLGTLSRYRVPMMPAYATLLLLLRARLNRPIDRRATPPTKRPASPRRLTAEGRAQLARLARHRERRPPRMVG